MNKLGLSQTVDSSKNYVKENKVCERTYYYLTDHCTTTIDINIHDIYAVCNWLASTWC